MLSITGNNLWVFLLIFIWTIPWKGLALWRAAQRNDKWWFIVFLVVNLFAIPEILYLIFTRASKKPADASAVTESGFPPRPI